MALRLAVETWAFETCTDRHTHQTGTWCVAQFPSQTSHSDFDKTLTEHKHNEFISQNLQTGIQWSDMFFNCDNENSTFLFHELQFVFSVLSCLFIASLLAW